MRRSQSSSFPYEESANFTELPLTPMGSLALITSSFSLPTFVENRHKALLYFCRFWKAWGVMGHDSYQLSVYDTVVAEGEVSTGLLVNGGKAVVPAIDRHVLWVKVASTAYTPASHNLIPDGRLGML